MSLKALSAIGTLISSFTEVKMGRDIGRGGCIGYGAGFHVEGRVGRDSDRGGRRLWVWFSLTWRVGWGETAARMGVGCGSGFHAEVKIGRGWERQQQV